MDAFPAMIPLHGRRVVVAGEGEMAEAKARLFDGSPADLLHLTGEAMFDGTAYAGAALAFIALPGEAAERAAAAARSAGALVNVVDRPALCDFTTPAIVDRGAVVGAVATSGLSPALAAELRQGLEAEWPPGLGRVAELADALKAEARARLPDAAARRGFLRELVRSPAAEAAQAGDMERALGLARAALAGAEPSPPRLVQADAPETADLISLRLLRLMSEADRLVLDPGLDPALVAYARRDAAVTRLVTAGAWAAPPEDQRPGTLTVWLRRT